jgi:hypothetical protein
MPGTLTGDLVSAKTVSQLVGAERVQYMDVSPAQIVSLLLRWLFLSTTMPTAR